MAKNFTAKTGDNSNVYQAEKLDVYNLNENSVEYIKLVKLYEQEKEKGDSISETIKQLIEYERKIDGDLKNLAIKLKEGGFEYLINDAERYKHKYSMHFHEHSVHKSAQKIHALLLSKVETQFNSFVKLKLYQNADKEDVISTISEKVIKEVEAIYGTHNILELDSRHIHGMVYYLTGNCFLNWKITNTI